MLMGANILSRNGRFNQRSGFHRIRSYGLLANCGRREQLAQVVVSIGLN
jgi:hypothetical protein